MSTTAKHRKVVDHTVHTGIMCDACSTKPIVGTRLKCVRCADYDLCGDCFDEGFQHPHGFVEVRVPKRRSGCDRVEPTNAIPTHLGVICDECRGYIRGVRYKCGNCSNYDLCGVCEEKSKHDPNHIFVKIRYPIAWSPTRPLLPPLYNSPTKATHGNDDLTFVRAYTSPLEKGVVVPSDECKRNEKNEPDIWKERKPEYCATDGSTSLYLTPVCTDEPACKRTIEMDDATESSAAEVTVVRSAQRLNYDTFGVAKKKDTADEDDVTNESSKSSSTEEDSCILTSTSSVESTDDEDKKHQEFTNDGPVYDIQGLKLLRFFKVQPKNDMADEVGVADESSEAPSTEEDCFKMGDNDDTSSSTSSAESSDGEGKSHQDFTNDDSVDMSVQYLKVQPKNDVADEDDVVDESLESSSIDEDCLKAGDNNDTPASTYAFALQQESIPGGIIVHPGQKFQKIWTVQNIGTGTWQPSVFLRQVGGHRMSKGNFSILREKSVQANEIVTFKTSFRAPTRAGFYTSCYTLWTKEGYIDREIFGARLYCKFTVVKPRRRWDATNLTAMTTEEVTASFPSSTKVPVTITFVDSASSSTAAAAASSPMEDSCTIEFPSPACSWPYSGSDRSTSPVSVTYESDGEEGIEIVSVSSRNTVAASDGQPNENIGKENGSESRPDDVNDDRSEMEDLDAKLAKLEEMGFTDRVKNKALLLDTNNRIPSVIELLLG